MSFATTHRVERYLKFVERLVKTRSPTPSAEEGRRRLPSSLRPAPQRDASVHAQRARGARKSAKALACKPFLRDGGESSSANPIGEGSCALDGVENQTNGLARIVAGIGNSINFKTVGAICKCETVSPIQPFPFKSGSMI